MAINKNFVVKNGLEVATDLILADAITGKVGIASTGPRTELDVRGGIAATDLTIVGVATIATLKLATGIVTDLTVENATIGISTINRLDSTYINSSGVTTVRLFNVTGIATVATGIVTNLRGTNLNYSGIGTVQNLNVTGIATIAVGIVTDLSGTNLNYSGIGTIATVDINAGDIEVTSVRTSNFSATGVSTIASLFVTGSTFDTLTVNNFSTLNGVTTVTNANITNLNVTGIATVSTVDINAGDIEVTSVRTSNLNTTGVSTLSNLSGTNLNYSGIGTIANLRSTNLNNTGIGTIISLNSTSGTITNLTGTAATIGSIKISSGIITATSGVVTYYGDGSNLTGLPGNPTLQSVLNTGNTSTIGMSISGISTLTILRGIDINISGICTAQDFDALSDINYKTNISTVENSLNIVNELHGVKFNWKESGIPSYGVIAQELQEILPELVHGDAIKTVNYNGIIGVLIEAIKELKREIDELKFHRVEK